MSPSDRRLRVRKTERGMYVQRKEGGGWRWSFREGEKRKSSEVHGCSEGNGEGRCDRRRWRHERLSGLLKEGVMCVCVLDLISTPLLPWKLHNELKVQDIRQLVCMCDWFCY